MAAGTDNHAPPPGGHPNNAHRITLSRNACQPPFVSGVRLVEGQATGGGWRGAWRLSGSPEEDRRLSQGGSAAESRWISPRSKVGQPLIRGVGRGRALLGSTAKTQGGAGGLRAEGEAWKFGGLEAWGDLTAKTQWGAGGLRAPPVALRASPADRSLPPSPPFCVPPCVLGGLLPGSPVGGSRPPIRPNPRNLRFPLVLSKREPRRRNGAREACGQRGRLGSLEAWRLGGL